MALVDILRRIEDDVDAETAHELAVASQRADSLLADARERAHARSAQIVDSARRVAETDAATLAAGARLATRDEALVAKRALVEDALERVSVAIESLPADRYACFLGEEIAANARSGDTVTLAQADAALLDDVKRVVATRAPAVELTWASEPAPLERGALVVGQRTRFELTPRSVVAERRGELEVEIAAALFGQEQ